jgi:hypothetical protein
MHTILDVVNILSQKYICQTTSNIERRNHLAVSKTDDLVTDMIDRRG